MSHSKSETSSSTPEELIANIQRLMDEVEAIINKPADAVARDASRRLADLQDRLSDMGGRVKGAYRTARRNVVDGARQADDVIRSKPYQSLAVALGVGLLIGAFLRRDSD